MKETRLLVLPCSPLHVLGCVDGFGFQVFREKVARNGSKWVSHCKSFFLPVDGALALEKLRCVTRSSFSTLIVYFLCLAFFSDDLLIL